jgi:hypothetical protein
MRIELTIDISISSNTLRISAQIFTSPIADANSIFKARNLGLALHF